jgi:hypothetical protein
VRPSYERIGREINAVPAETPRHSSAFVLNNPPIRWAKSAVPVNIDVGAHTGLAGGGVPQTLAAIAQFNAVGSSLTLQNGARVPPRCQSVVGTDILVTFNDPCFEISSDPNVLAVAAFGFLTSGPPMVVGGQSFFPITDVVITSSSNPAAQDLLRVSSCFQSTMAHELGHAIGLGHSADPNALMFATESGSCLSGPHHFTADDIAGVLAIYPSTQPPTGGGTPGMPTVTSATVVGGNLQIAWTSGAGATPTAYRLDFFAGATTVASLTVGAVTSTSIPIPPGTTGSFTVRVTALVGATAGPGSAPFPFTLGSGGTPPPPPGGCTAPPAAPVVTGSLVAGNATVTWGAVAGATFYIVSAGSTQGGTNLYPPTNVGTNTSVGASGLPAGFTAWVRVIAVNACGQSAPADFFLTSGGAPPPPPPAAGASISFQALPGACACWVNPISLQIDGQTVGSMTCTGTAGPFPVAAGAHTYQACDSGGCLSNNTTLQPSGSLTVTLSCQ